MDIQTLEKRIDQKEAIRFMIEEIEDAMSQKDFQRKYFKLLREQFEKSTSLSFGQFNSLTKMFKRVTGQGVVK